MNEDIHKQATTFESKENPSTIQELNVNCKTQEKDIQECITSSTESAYLKLMQTYYKMELTPSMSHKHFEVLVKCQRENAVHLIEGKYDYRADKQFTC